MSQEDGLNPNYILHKIDGRTVDPEGRYFVLKLNSDKSSHAAASRKAALAYANEIEGELPVLAEDLRCIVEDLEKENRLISEDPE